MISNPVCLVDVDGILTDYPKVFLHWVEQNYGTKYQSLQEMKNNIPKQRYKAIKEQYRNSGVKRILPVITKMKYLLQYIELVGIDIWVVTTRPSSEPVKTDTIYWLRNNGIAHNKIYFVKDKKQFIKKTIQENQNVMMIIDDNLRGIL